MTGGFNICRASGNYIQKITTFLGKYFYFPGLGKQTKLQGEDKILGSTENYINCMGKLNAEPEKQCQLSDIAVLPIH